MGFPGPGGHGGQGWPARSALVGMGVGLGLSRPEIVLTDVSPKGELWATRCSSFSERPTSPSPSALFWCRPFSSPRIPSSIPKCILWSEKGKQNHWLVFFDRKPFSVASGSPERKVGRPPGGPLSTWPCARSMWSPPAILGLSGRAPVEAQHALGALSEEEREG